MEGIINSLFVRPVLWLANYVRRHPWKTAGLLLVLFLGLSLYQFLQFVAVRIAALFPGRVAQAVSAKMLEATVWLEAKPSRRWLVAGALTMFLPPLGWSLTAWNLADTIRERRASEPTAPAATDTPPAAGAGDVAGATGSVVTDAVGAVGQWFMSWWE